MTDLTDQDRRDMLEWARIAVASKGTQEHEPWVTAARVILATVDAPEPTLAEEMANITEHWKEWTTNTITAKLTAATDRAKQVENDRDAARAEVKRERDLGDALAHERDDTRAEVERLTAENENLRRTDNYRQFREQFLTVQKGAESNAETPDPADVKPGEAWIVETHGEICAAVKGGTDDLEWKAASPDSFVSSEGNEDITLITRLVPAPRVITNADNLDRAKRCTVIRDAAGVVCERDGMGDAWTTFTSLADQRPHIALPATVLWEPDA